MFLSIFKIQFLTQLRNFHLFIVTISSEAIDTGWDNPELRKGLVCCCYYGNLLPPGGNVRACACACVCYSHIWLFATLWTVCVCVCVCLLQSHLTLCNPLDCSPPSSSVHGISKQAYWSRLPCSPPRDVPNPGIKPVSHMSSALAGGFFTISATWEALMAMHLLIKSSKKKANP